MKITKSKLREIIAEEVSLREQDKRRRTVVNEDCKKEDIQEVVNEMANISEEDMYDSLQREKEAFKNVVSSVLGPKLIGGIDRITMDRILTAMAFSYNLGKKRGMEEPEEEGMPGSGEEQR